MKVNKALTEVIRAKIEKRAKRKADEISKKHMKKAKEMVKQFNKLRTERRKLSNKISKVRNDMNELQAKVSEISKGTLRIQELTEKSKVVETGNTYNILNSNTLLNQIIVDIEYAENKKEVKKILAKIERL